MLTLTMLKLITAMNFCSQGAPENADIAKCRYRVFKCLKNTVRLENQKECLK